MALVAGFVLLAGIISAGGRAKLEGVRTSRRSRKSAGSDRAAGTREPASTSGARGQGDSTFVRSWLAIALVGALVISVPLSFMLDDTTLRSALVGGLVANAGAATAFYFASKSSEQARRDILSASMGTTSVPELRGMGYTKATELLASTSLRLEPTPPHPRDGAQVVDQVPPPGQQVLHNSPVAVTFAGPVPDLKGKSLSEATAATAAVNLTLVPEPTSPGSGDVVVDQTPRLNENVPIDRAVNAKFGAPDSGDPDAQAAEPGTPPTPESESASPRRRRRSATTPEGDDSATAATGGEPTGTGEQG